MFNSTKIIVAISKSTITVSMVKLGATPLVEKHEVYNWTPESLAEILQAIKRNFGSSIRILFSDEFVYVATVKLDNPTSATRASIQSAAQELIPEDLNKTSWDYRVYPDYIQVIVLNTSIYSQITDAVKKAEIEIEAIESYTSALARLTTSETEPFMLLYQDNISLIITINKGVILTTEVLQNSLSETDIEKAMRFAQEQFSLIIKKIIKTDTIGNIFTGEFFKECTIESKNLDPAIGMALKTDIKISDAKSLNLEIDQTATKKIHHRSYQPYIMFVISFLITLAVAFVGRNYFIKETPVESAARPVSITPSVAPTATPSATLVDEISIKILNNSGLSGEDERLTDILLENNYKNITSDNTTEKVTGIKVTYSARVDDSYLKELDKLLKNIYTTVATPEAKLASDEADITIIIGTFKPK